MSKDNSDDRKASISNQQHESDTPKSDIPSPPTNPAPNIRKKSVMNLRWRPSAPATMRERKENLARKQPTRMNLAARRLLGLMSVMMTGKAMGVQTGALQKLREDIQTTMEGDIC